MYSSMKRILSNRSPNLRIVFFDRCWREEKKRKGKKRNETKRNEQGYKMVGRGVSLMGLSSFLVFLGTTVPTSVEKGAIRSIPISSPKC